MLKVQPFFILSNPRSGSSLLRVICDSHNQIAVPPECGFTEWWFNKYKDWSQKDNNTHRLESFCKDLALSRKFETWNFNFIAFKDQVKKFAPSTYAEMAALVHISFGLMRSKKLKSWGDKNNYFIHKTSFLNSLYPQGKFIFIVRDGRDVATSYKALKELKSSSPYVPVLPYEIAEIALEWKKNNEKLYSFTKTLNNQRVLILRYEDLVCELEQTCKTICKFLSVPFDPQMLIYHTLNKEINMEPVETLDWKKKTLKSPDKLSIGKYKKILTGEEISLFNTMAGETLKKFHYES